MIIGIGIDLIEVARVAKVCETNKRFVERVFAESEIEYSMRNKKSPYQHLAACWSAKEAFYKATNIKCNFADVVVAHFDTGQPYFIFGETAKTGIEMIESSHSAVELNPEKNADAIQRNHGSIKCHLSISHIKDYATAVVVVEL
jgi:holo-[acyl-carrier protein] synthase